MAWTKLQLVTAALDEIGVSDPDPGQLSKALQRLDALMATWEANGIGIGYALPPDPSASSVNDPSGIPDTAAETVFCSLAIRLAPSYGKTVSAETRQAARQGYDALLLAAAQPQEMQYGAQMPMGAGNKAWRGTGRPFYPQPDTSPLDTAQGGDLVILPE